MRIVDTTLRVFALSTLAGLVILLFYNREYLSVASDFISQYVGSRILINGESVNLYDLQVQFRHQEQVIGEGSADWVLPFRGLPFVILIYLPFSFFPITTAYLLFFIFNLSVLFLIYFLLFKLFPVIKNKAKHLFLLIFLFTPALQSLWMGQLSIVLLSVYIFIYKTLVEKKYFLSGFISSLLLIKIQHVLFIPFLFVMSEDKKRFLGGFLISMVLIFSINFLISGFSLFDYPLFLLETESSGFGSRTNEMLTLYSALRSFFPDTQTAKLLAIHFILYSAVILLFAVSKTSKKDNLFVSAVFFTSAFSVHMLGYDLVLLIVPLFIFIERMYSADIRGDRMKSYLAAVFIFLLPYLTIFGVTYYLSLVHVVLGMYFLFYDNSFRVLDKNTKLIC